MKGGKRFLNQAKSGARALPARLKQKADRGRLEKRERPRKQRPKRRAR